MFPIPQTSFLVGTFVATSYSKTALVDICVYEAANLDNFYCQFFFIEMMESQHPFDFI